MVYLGIVSYGMAGTVYEIKHLPLGKSLDECPYWLVMKLNYIKDRLNIAKSEIKPKKGG